MGRRFDSYFQETEIAQWVEQFTQTFNLFIARKGTIGNKKLKNFFSNREFIL